MRQLALIAALIVLAAPAAARAQSPPLRAKLTACRSGEQPTDRVAVVTASMPPVKGTWRMAMRFDLLGRAGATGPFARIKVPALAVWHRSVPGRPGGFVFTQRVQGLTAPGTYKVVVRFRWYGRDGTLLRAASRQTATCKQPDQRPDLQATGLDVVPGPASGQAIYRVTVANDGRSSADPFDVVLGVNGVDQPAVRLVDGLAAGAEQEVSLVAPACAPGSTVRVVVDAHAEIDERQESDDVLSVLCPFAGVTAPGSS